RKWKESQSTSAGCVDHATCEANSFIAFTNPAPENIAQYRFTVTGAVSGFSGDTRHTARSRRFNGPAGSVAGFDGVGGDADADEESAGFGFSDAPGVDESAAATVEAVRSLERLAAAPSDGPDSCCANRRRP